MNGTAILALVWLFWIMLERMPPRGIPRLVAVIMATGQAGGAVTNLLSGHTAEGIVGAGFTGWLAWCLWKGRKPRQRKPSKVLGFIRDLGHRLVVTS